MTSSLTQILERYPLERASLIPILQDIQEKDGYLSPSALAQLSEKLNISDNEIFGVATFYSQFRFHPPGENTIQVCLGTACHVRGGHQILGELEQRLGITAGQTTHDKKFDLQRVACLGCCALAPVVKVNGDIHAKMSTRKIPALLRKYQGERNPE